jgi:hypothetical protein
MPVFLHFINPCFTEMCDGPVWRFLQRKCEITEEDFSHGHLENSDEVSDQEWQASHKFHCTSATIDTEKVCVYNETYLSMNFTWAGN